VLHCGCPGLLPWAPSCSRLRGTTPQPRGDGPCGAGRPRRARPWCRRSARSTRRTWLGFPGSHPAGEGPSSRSPCHGAAVTEHESRILAESRCVRHFFLLLWHRRPLPVLKHFGCADRRSRWRRPSEADASHRPGRNTVSYTLDRHHQKYYSLPSAKEEGQVVRPPSQFQFFVYIISSKLEEISFTTELEPFIIWSQASQTKCWPGSSFWTT
jgi:hypothetical protein